MARKKREYIIAVADSETDPFDGITIPEPFLWGYYDGKEYKEFTETREFMRHIYTIEKPTIIYAHNGGRFDWHFILDYLPDLSSVTIINGRIASFKIAECEFRDSYNILPTKLKNMQKDDFDYTKMFKHVRDQYMPEISAYLKSDCVYLHNYVSGFIRDYGLHLTQAGAAMKYWENMTDDPVPNDEGGILYDTFSPFYYGGRCEAIKTGIFKGKYTLVDINSAYPFAMCSLHPYSLDYDEINMTQFRRLPEKEKGSCFITLTGVCKGAFPFRAENGELIFPRDDIIRTWHVTGWEYLVALETGALKNYRIDAVYCFDDLIDFKEYVSYFYELRRLAKQSGDKQTDLYAKIFMNSLYGKFAANPRNYANFKVIDGCHINEDGHVRGRGVEEIGKGWQFAGQFGSRFLASKPLEPSEMRFYNIATAASITGYVRAMLWRAMCQCREVVYCDTDSILALDIRNLPLGDALGQFKLEHEYTRIGIGGKKLYVLEDKDGEFKTASKGARLTPDELFRLAKGEEIMYHPEAPTFSVHHAPQFVNRKLKKK